ncbi:glycerophosphoryl diester phosphodiesterase membrane domain-containing protein [Gulosibacter faecalis]|uniref:Glycerophosphoryl diester phosphodiesterase membrane domain-containing protein n=1 Tax=Gulosibacter faecalis TaxID=272240 RepID=A0ABW5V031_9MICO|nr:glycerophosphoryl diester phosphodiesterase membrane domain-containing protein [Gulosibacter faecalis]
MTNDYQQPGYPPQGAASWNYDTSGQGPQPTGWRPPPKPGLFPLRPLSFGDIFSATFRLLRVNVAASFGGAFLVQLVTGLLSAVLPIVALIVGSNRLAMTTSGQVANELGVAMFGWVMLAFIPGIIIALIGNALVQVIVAQVVAAGALGQSVTLGAAFKQAFSRIWSVLGYLLLVGLGATVITGVLALPIIFTVLGVINDNGTWPLLVLLILLVVFGGLALYFWLSTKLLLAVSAIVLEKLGPIAAIGRSWKLTKGYFWRTLGIWILVAFIVSLATQAISSVFSFIFSMFGVFVPFGDIATGQEAITIGAGITLTLMSVVLSTILAAISTVLVGGNATIMYTDLRMRKEGLNIHLQQAAEDVNEGREPSTDPWTAPDLGPVEPQQPAYVATPQYGGQAYPPQQPHGAYGQGDQGTFGQPQYGQQPYAQQPYGQQQYGQPVDPNAQSGGYAAPQQGWGQPAPSADAGQPTDAPSYEQPAATPYQPFPQDGQQPPQPETPDAAAPRSPYASGASDQSGGSSESDASGAGDDPTRPRGE